MFYSRISVEFFFFIQYLHKFLLYTNHVIHVTWFSWVGRMYRQTGNREPDQFTGKRITVNSRHPHRRREWHCPAGRIFLLRLCRDKGPPICAVTRTLVSQSHCSPMSSLVLTAPPSSSTPSTQEGTLNLTSIQHIYNCHYRRAEKSPAMHTSLRVKGHPFPCCCSVIKSCPTLCDPLDCSTPDLPCPLPSPGVCPSSCSLHVLPVY